MSASNTLEAEDPAHAQELADRRDAERWRKLRAADPDRLAELRDPASWMVDDLAIASDVLADRDHHFARAEQAVEEKFADAVAAEDEAAGLRLRVGELESSVRQLGQHLDSAERTMLNLDAALAKAHATNAELGGGNS